MMRRLVTALLLVGLLVVGARLTMLYMVKELPDRMEVPYSYLTNAPGYELAAASDQSLIYCTDDYCPGSYGMIPGNRDTGAKLAIIRIWRLPAAAQYLTNLFPKCNGTGQAYVLAALWHLDPESFRRLTPEFLGGPRIPVASYDVVSSEERSDLISLMQQTNCTLAFKNPPLTRSEVGEIFRKDEATHQAIFEKTKEWAQASKVYELSPPYEDRLAGRLVSMKRKGSGMPFNIDWSWTNVNGAWGPSIPFREISKVVAEIEDTPFIQKINKETRLDIALYAVNGNFYRQGMTMNLTAEEDEDVTEAKSLLQAVGFTGTNRLVYIIARSSTGPLILWHPIGSHFWMITWNIQISRAWADAYEKQTGLQLTDTETASGWVGTCDDAGTLKMVRCSLAKSIAEKVQEQIAEREKRRNQGTQN